MSAVGRGKNSKAKTALAAVICASMTGVSSVRADTPMTAGVVLEKMPSAEFVVFVSGIVEGLAYARFRSDTKAAGAKTETGMKCIRNWFYGEPKRILGIEATFRKYADHMPWVVIAAMVKKECGE